MFLTTLPLRMAHCDPAGIGYYPSLLELCDAAIEDWTAAVLGIDRKTMHLEMGLGLPTISLDAQFNKPTRLGERLDFAVSITRVGSSSVDLAVDVTCGGKHRFGIHYAQVLVDLAEMKSRQWPTDILERLNREKS